MLVSRRRGRFARVKREALLDTGSPISIVSKEVTVSLGVLVELPTWDQRRFIGVDGVTVKMLGRTKLRVCIYGQNVEHEFWVTDREPVRPCVLGRDFLGRVGMRLRPEASEHIQEESRTQWFGIA